jgi:hypothetical protein
MECSITLALTLLVAPLRVRAEGVAQEAIR